MSGKLKILIIVFYYDSTIFIIYCCDSKNNIPIFSHIGNLKLLLMPSILHSTLLLLLLFMEFYKIFIFILNY